MRKLYIAGLSLILLACQADQPASDDQTQTADTPTVVRPPTPEITTSTEAWDTLYRQNDIIIVGDTSFRERYFVYRRFSPGVSFSEYSAEPSGNPTKARVDVSSNPLARQFRTVIQDTYTRENSNFAGHYVWISWGCGTACQQNVIVDTRSGKVYTAPETSVGAAFRRDSRLLIANPPDASGYYPDCASCTPQIYVWDEEAREFTQPAPVN
jgi:hypothetical protein